MKCCASGAAGSVSHVRFMLQLVAALTSSFPAAADPSSNNLGAESTKRLTAKPVALDSFVGMVRLITIARVA
jgi:hypothetical protein